MMSLDTDLRPGNDSHADMPTSSHQGDGYARVDAVAGRQRDEGYV